jgi:hypothetical protein
VLGFQVGLDCSSVAGTLCAAARSLSGLSSIAFPDTALRLNRSSTPR